ncbi:CehA/McbA family metallohydrolase [Candidatus Margulisiibacteriota bacterium]
MGKADLHIHSDYGDGLASVKEIMDYVEHKTDLHVIAITDHDDIEGSLKAKELARNYRFDVIVGIEVTTWWGHLLCYDIKNPIRKFTSLEQTLDETHEQGGFCIIPHPMSFLTCSVGKRAIEKIHVEKKRFDGIEIWNPSGAGMVRQERAMQLNTQWKYPETGGSDAHVKENIGRAYTEFPGTTVSDFRRALKEKTTIAYGMPLYRSHYAHEIQLRFKKHKWNLWRIMWG